MEGRNKGGNFNEDKAKCQNSAEANNRIYKSMKNKAKNAVSKAMRDEDEEVLTELKTFSKWDV